MTSTETQREQDEHVLCPRGADFNATQALNMPWPCCAARSEGTRLSSGLVGFLPKVRIPGRSALLSPREQSTQPVVCKGGPTPYPLCSSSSRRHLPASLTDLPILQLPTEEQTILLKYINAGLRPQKAMSPT